MNCAESKVIEIMVCSLYSSANKLGNYVTVTGFVQSLKICPAIFQTWKELGMSKFTRSTKNCEKLEKSQNLLKLLNSSGKGDRRLPSKNCHFSKNCENWRKRRIC